MAKRKNGSIVVFEGERAADAAARLLPDHVAITSLNGAKGAAHATGRRSRGAPS